MTGELNAVKRSASFSFSLRTPKLEFCSRLCLWILHKVSHAFIILYCLIEVSCGEFSCLFPDKIIILMTYC